MQSDSGGRGDHSVAHKSPEHENSGSQQRRMWETAWSWVCAVNRRWRYDIQPTLAEVLRDLRETRFLFDFDLEDH